MNPKDSFERVASLYGQARPGYPPALFADLESLGALTSASRVLEAGCGAGQATGDLAARAARVSALDPGPRLIEEARARAPGANVDWIVARFEDFEPAPGAFDLVASAQAWHWVAPEVSFAKAALALRSGGALAVFGHVPLPPAEPLLSGFQRAFSAHAPELWGLPPPQAAYLPSGPFTAMFEASGLFGPVVHRRYSWTWRLDPASLGRYLRTDSGYHVLEEARRFALFDALAAEAAALGEAVDLPWETHLYLAHKP
jgi:SAM-dependent methyltransferase